VADARADPTVAICAIQFAPRPVCYEALSLTLLLFLAKPLIAATNKPRIVYEVTEIGHLAKRFSIHHPTRFFIRSLAMYRDLALADVSGEYEQAMRSFPVR
jgi:hypothetical protein